MKNLVFIAALLVLRTTVAHAELAPDEVAVIVADGNANSAALAKYYVGKRNIPADNICSVKVPDSESLTSIEWEQTVRPTIRQWLEENNRRNTIRCLVTTWGIPIRIEASPPDRVAHYEKFATGEYERRLDLLASLIKKMDAMSGKDSATSELLKENEVDVSTTDTTKTDDSKTDTSGTDTVESGTVASDEKTKSLSPVERPHLRLARQLTVAVLQAQQTAATLSPDKVTPFATQLEQAYLQGVGPIGMFDGFSQALKKVQSPTAEQVGQLEQLRGRIIGLNEARMIIARRELPSLARENLTLGIVEQAGGLVQSLGWLDEQRQVAAKNETLASFDSELSLVLWPDYERLRWQLNLLNANASMHWLTETHPTMMVSRIDGPTLRIAKQIIDTAIEVETSGLDGKVYLDARGLIKDTTIPTAPGSNEAYDQSLLRTAELIQELPNKLDVVVDQQADLFQPGQCPDAALYCGWYSLAEYIDAFEWRPGAVAYHTASAEATTLKKEGSNVWCKRLLEDGVCATLGPVAEPYLQAFPPPHEFFPRLMSGETLVETYYGTKPYNSWMMMLIGDPLYRPWR